MSTVSPSFQAEGFSRSHPLRKQRIAIGALMMRELHTRYGRDNVGYLWLIGEPLMLGSVVALMHSGQKAHGDINPVALSVAGYTIFIMFRSIVNRSEGAIEGNAPLLYHKMVTVLDITVSRALLEAAGTFMSFTILFGVCMVLGYTGLPARPLALLGGIGYVLWISLAASMLITGGTHDNRLLGRLVHPFTYFMIPLSAAFFRVSWLPPGYRDALLYIPLPHMFELLRYGIFESATLDYVDFGYITAFCGIATLLGMIALRSVRRRIHLH